MRLLLENARLFYEVGSDEVNCVNQLEEVFTGRLQEYASRFSTHGESYNNIRESVDSLCRDGADTPMPPYIGKASHTHKF